MKWVLQPGSVSYSALDVIRNAASNRNGGKYDNGEGEERRRKVRGLNLSNCS